MRKIFYIEGVDNSGKTTLANQICKNLDAKYIHCSWSPTINMCIGEYLKKKWLDVLDASTKNHVILDRHFVSTLVYDCVYRNSNLQKDKSFVKFCQEIKEMINNSKEIIPIFCNLEFDSWVRAYQISIVENGKSEMYKMDDNLIKVYNIYKGINTFSGINFHYHDFEKAPIDYMSLINKK